MVMARLPQDEIDRAVEALREGEVVAFPTETVYGLGADAQNPEAVRRIFELKGRPATHPLIVHLDHPRLLERWALSVPPAAQALADRFWPGPLTLVLRRAPAVDLAITGGQDTVAVRVPGHPVAQQLLRAFGSGIAAPSANRYGRVSPTRAEHVRDEFGDAVKVVLDGGDCKIGLESTIVSCVDAVPRVLRPGFITFRSCAPSCRRSSEGRGRARRACRAPTPSTTLLPRRSASSPAASSRRSSRSSPRTTRRSRCWRCGRRVVANKFMTWVNAGRRADVYASRALREPAHARQGPARGRSWSRKCRPASSGTPCATACGARRRPRTSSASTPTSPRCARTSARTRAPHEATASESWPAAAGNHADRHPRPCGRRARGARHRGRHRRVPRLLGRRLRVRRRRGARAAGRRDRRRAARSGGASPVRCWPASGTRASCRVSTPAIRPPRSARSTCAAGCWCTRRTPGRRDW